MTDFKHGVWYLIILFMLVSCEPTHMTRQQVIDATKECTDANMDYVILHFTWDYEKKTGTPYEVVCVKQSEDL